jgi:16S rRNA processing protein RimM
MIDGLLEVGRITKPHGLNGEVVVDLWSDLDDRLDPSSVLESERGPMTVISSRMHQGKHLVRFEGFHDRSGVEELRGLVLLAEPRDVPGALWIHELIGCAVELTDGTPVGVVASIEANPASDLCVLEDGRLIPLVFMVSHVPNATMVIDPPEGLLE